MNGGRTRDRPARQHGNQGHLRTIPERKPPHQSGADQISAAIHNNAALQQPETTRKPCQSNHDRGHAHPGGTGDSISKTQLHTERRRRLLKTARARKHSLQDLRAGWRAFNNIGMARFHLSYFHKIH
jgi:hypothetical protein